MSPTAPRFEEADPFELPEWLGGAVTWASESGIRGRHKVAGCLTPDDAEGSLDCDLLAVDEAHPAPVAPDDVRTRAHLAWSHGQVLLLEVDDRLTVAVPGTTFTADLVLDALGRLAKAVGAFPDDYAARLRIGRDRR